MTGEIPDNELATQLKQELEKQDALKKRFEDAFPANEYREEIHLGYYYQKVTEFRMDRTAFLVRHIPTTIIGAWSVMTGPRRLKESVEGWVDKILEIYPKPTGK